MAENPADRIHNLYVHVPFCAQKCGYCAFFSEAASGELINRYVAALVRVRFDMLQPDPLARHLVAGGAGRVDQAAQKIQR